jgi:hypothetical protein
MIGILITAKYGRQSASGRFYGRGISANGAGQGFRYRYIIKRIPGWVMNGRATWLSFVIVAMRRNINNEKNAKSLFCREGIQKLLSNQIVKM